MKKEHNRIYIIFIAANITPRNKWPTVVDSAFFFFFFKKPSHVFRSDIDFERNGKKRALYSK